MQKNEIFVDLLERMTVLVAANGNVLRSHIDGSLQMKSFLGGNAGTATCLLPLLSLCFSLPLYVCMSVCHSISHCSFPEVHFGLNEDLVIGKEEGRGLLGAVVLDDCSFHENANLTDFDRDRTISMAAISGEVQTLLVCIAAIIHVCACMQIYV